jgi:hypothetical protein
MLRPVARRLVHLSLLSAWLCASGAMLDVTQLVAWGRMFAGYARTESLSDAARETFDPGKPCAICRAVSQAREASAPAAVRPNSAEKLILISEVPAEFVARDELPPWPVPGARRADTRANDVPVPPPRGLAADFAA